MVTATPIDIGTLIARKRGVRGGRPYVVGAGVTVRRIVNMRYKQGLTPEQIVDEMPHLSLAGVHAALAYYHANKAQLDADFADEETREAQITQDWLRSESEK
jgi:uncharacterized protein (DUF433 family)